MTSRTIAKSNAGKKKAAPSPGGMQRLARRNGEFTDYLRAIVNSLEDELIVFDKDYRVVECNEAVLLRHGKSRAEVIGKRCYEVSYQFTKPCAPPYHECPVRAVWEEGKAARTTHTHTHYVNGGKRRRYLDIIASPVADHEGNIIAVTELTRDVTESRELESRITEAHENLSALNAIASVVSKSLDLDTVLRSALAKTLEIMRGNIGGILLMDEEEKRLCYRVHQGFSARYVGEMCLTLGEGIAGRVAQTGESIILEDISTDPRAVFPELLSKEGLRAFASIPISSKEKVLGVLDIARHDGRKFSDEDVQLLESIAAQVAVAIENARLHQEVQRKEEIRGELLREIFSIQEEERKRIARELHDETSQVLASLAANLEAASGLLPRGATEAEARLRKTQALSISMLDGIHKLIYELRPSLLDDLGLVTAIRWLLENNLEPAGTAVQFGIIGQERRLPPELETTLFRVVQEAVTNIVRHAHARKASVRLHFKRKTIGVDVKDNGTGFDVDEAIATRERPRGLGLIGMKERVELMNGTLDIRSRPGNGGTVVKMIIPFEGKRNDG